MEEVNSNSNDQSILTSLEGESSSFILQPNLNDNQQDEKVSYQLKVPLCVSQIYEEEFYDHFHMNYYGEIEHEGLFVASIRLIPIKNNEIDNKSSFGFSKINNNDDKQLIRAIIRTPINNYHVSEFINVDNEKNILQVLFAKAQLSSIHNYELIHYIKANEKILEFDKYIDDQHTNKIALLFQRLNQSNENEILGNNEMSIEMENFVNLISERIELKDFNKYRGDLDIKTNQHGIYSYFTTFETHQIMFNISPIIPSEKNDQQFIQRKSLIANALLSIVFQEEGTLFQPNFILGKVTQVYITVQPIYLNSQLYYKIEIWRRDDIEPLIDPPGGTFKHDESFRSYFLTLILNTMSTILKKECFHLRIIQQRKRLKTEYLQKLFQIFHSFLKDDSLISYKIENIDKRKPTLYKPHHLGIIPRIIETFTNYRSKPNSSDNQSTSTANKQNLVMSINESMKRSSIPNSTMSIPQPKIEIKLSSSVPDSVLYYPEGSERPIETITSLDKNLGSTIGSNNQTPSSISTVNNNTNNQSERI